MPRGRCRTGRTPKTAGCRAPSAADGQGPAPRRGRRPAAVLHVEDLQAGDGEGHPEGGRRPCADPHLRRHGRYRARDAPAPGAGESHGGLVGVVHRWRAAREVLPRRAGSLRRARDRRGGATVVRLRRPSRPASGPRLLQGCPLGAVATPLGAGDRAVGRAASAAPGSAPGPRPVAVHRRRRRVTALSRGRQPCRHGRADASSPRPHAAGARRRPGAAVHRRCAPGPHGPLHAAGDPG